MCKTKMKSFIAFATGLLVTAGVFADDAGLAAKIEKLEKTVESQGEQLQRLQTHPVPNSTSNGASDTTVGGYGEISYNAYRKESSRNQIDLKRFVIFLGHRFSERWSFNSEVEWEHAVTSADDEGETALEQAYLNYQFKPGVNLKTGLFLMPFGFLNQNHEPPVFFGVERNEVETRIIPSTWREGGVGLNGTTGFGLATEVGVTTGFDIAKFDDPAAPLASIHQELQLAKARDLALYGALNYLGIPGFNVGGALFSGKSAHGNAHFKADPAEPDLAGVDARVTLWESHVRLQKKGWDLQALYAEGRIGDAAKIDATLQAFNTANSAARAFVPEQFNGWLLQGAYTVWRRGEASLTPFIRHEKYNTQVKMPEGFASDPANADRVTTFGFSFKPHPQVVFKTDYQSFKDNHSNNRFNAGLGYMF